MAKTEADIKDLKAMIAVAKQKPINFGVCPGKTAETLEIRMDRKRNPAALGREAKAAGETAKVAFGTMTVDGKTATLICENKPPTGLTKDLKKFFSSVDLPMKFVIGAED